MTSTKTKKKVVKAWAIIHYTGELEYAAYIMNHDCCSPSNAVAIYDSKRDAVEELENQLGAGHFDIVPCEIIYSLPSKKN